MITTATDKQLSFIAKLISEKDITTIEQNVIDAILADPDTTKQMASRTIDLLMSKPRKTASPAVSGDIEGMHKIGDMIFKVQRAIHGSGNLYAKRLVVYGNVEEGYTAAFEYAPGAIRRLSEATKMTLEDAKAFGALYGTCAVCGRTLTNESSIEAGIGPVCSSKF